MNKILCCALVFLFLFLLVAPHAVYAYPGEMNGTVTQIVDGDTFYFVALNGTKYTIRMADVNASEIGQTGYVEAKAALDSMIYGKTVYLDVDDLYIWDNRGTGSRVVAIPYIDHNSTHFLNVNEAMFQGGYVEKRDYRNEFNPYTWRLYEPKAQGIPEFPIVTALVVLLAAGAIVGIVLKRRLIARRFGFFTG